MKYIENASMYVYQYSMEVREQFVGSSIGQVLSLGSSCPFP